MRGTGDILQWNNHEKRGTIHLGGGNHSALLSFALGDCDAKLKGILAGGDVPPGKSAPVQFDIKLRKGALVGAKVRPRGLKPSTRKKRVPRAKPRRR